MSLAAASAIPASKPPLLVVQYANPDYYPPTINAVSLMRARFDVHLICRNIDPPACEWPADVRVERVGDFALAKAREAAGSLSKLREFMSFVHAVARRRRALRPRLLYAYDVHALASVFMGRREPHHLCPVLYQAHEQPEMEELPLSSLQTWIARYAMRKGPSAALVVFPEKYRANYYMRAAADRRLPMIVPNCPSRTLLPRLPELGALIEQRWRKREVLLTGSIGVGIGIIEAISALAQLDEPAGLRVFGQTMSPEVERMMAETARSLGISERVVYEGFAPLTEVIARTMESSAGLILYRRPTLNEVHMGSASNKLFEYAARGIPAIVPHNKSFSEFLEGEQWVAYADPSDPASLAAAIGSVFADKSRYGAMCAAARRFFEEKFNYERAFAPVLERMLALARQPATRQGTD